MKVLLTAVAEPQICFPVGSFTLCNWTRNGIYAVSSKKGWMKVPRRHAKKKDDTEKMVEEVEKTERASSLN